MSCFGTDASLAALRLVLGTSPIDYRRIQSSATTARPPPPSLGRFCFCCCFCGVWGAAPRNGPPGPQFASEGRAPFLGTFGVPQIHRDRILICFLIFLNILIPIFGLRKTCREVPFSVPGSPLFRAGKSLFPCREVPFTWPLFNAHLWNRFVQKRAGKSPAKIIAFCNLGASRSVEQPRLSPEDNALSVAVRP